MGLGKGCENLFFLAAALLAFARGSRFCLSPGLSERTAQGFDSRLFALFSVNLFSGFEIDDFVSHVPT